MMDVLINLIVAIISQCIWVLDHHIAYLKKNHIVQPKYRQFKICQSYLSKTGKNIPRFIFFSLSSLLPIQ